MRQKIVSIIFASALLLIMFTLVTPLGHSTVWSPDTRLTWKTDSDTFPAATQTGDGRIWVIWSSYRTGNADLFYKVYNASAVHPWSPDIQLTNNPNEDTTPSIMQASNGVIWVVWKTNRTGNEEIYYKTYSGAAWSSDNPLITDPSAKHLAPSIMQAANGTIWVVWSSNLSGQFQIHYTVSSDNGATWSPHDNTLTDTIEANRDPAIMQAANGSIWVVWVRTKDLYYSLYSGVEWSEAAQLTTDPLNDTHPSIAQASDETVWVVWDSNRSMAQYDIYYKTYSGTWSTDTGLTTDPANDIAPSILRAADSNIWVFWYSSRLDNIDIYYRKSSIPDPNDVEIISVEPITPMVAQNQFATVEVVALNKGGTSKTFQISLYMDSTLIGSTTVQVAPGQLYPKLFTWNVSAASLGQHPIRGEASIVPGETNTADNTYYSSIIIVTHDVALKSVTTSRTIVGKGYKVNVYVLVKNEGNFTETVRVTAYFDSTGINTYTIVGFAPNNEVMLTFPWTTGASYGSYIISAKASQMLDELDVADNSLTDGTVLVTIPGDVNGDKSVNILDAGAVSGHWYTPPAPPGPGGYDPIMDINSDGKIDILDAAIVNTNWLQSW